MKHMNEFMKFMTFIWKVHERAYFEFMNFFLVHRVHISDMNSMNCSMNVHMVHEFVHEPNFSSSWTFLFMNFMDSFMNRMNTIHEFHEVHEFVNLFFSFMNENTSSWTFHALSYELHELLYELFYFKVHEFIPWTFFTIHELVHELLFNKVHEFIHQIHEQVHGIHEPIFQNLSWKSSIFFHSWHLPIS